MNAQIAFVSLKSPLRRMFGCVLTTAVCIQTGSAAPFGFPGTVSSSGVLWDLSNNTTAFGVAPGGFGLTEAEFANPAQGVDLYDGAWLLRVNGAYIASPGPVDFANSTLTTTPATTAANASIPQNVSVQTQLWFPGNIPFVRAIYSFSNTGNAAAQLRATIEVNLGSDMATTVRGNGGASRWVISSDTAIQNGDAISTIARYGENAALNPLTTANSSLPGTANGSGRKDAFVDEYDLNIPAGETWRLMLFGRADSIATGLSDGVDTASAFDTKYFDDYQKMIDDGLLAGAPGAIPQIKNWGLVPEPSSVSLLLIGGAVAIFLRRARVQQAR